MLLGFGRRCCYCSCRILALPPPPPRTLDIGTRTFLFSTCITIAVARDVARTVALFNFESLSSYCLLVLMPHNRSILNSHNLYSSRLANSFVSRASSVYPLNSIMFSSNNNDDAPPPSSDHFSRPCDARVFRATICK